MELIKVIGYRKEEIFVFTEQLNKLGSKIIALSIPNISSPLIPTHIPNIMTRTGTKGQIGTIITFNLFQNSTSNINFKMVYFG